MLTNQSPFDDSATEERLARLGLSVELLHDAALVAMARRRQCGALHPKNASGFFFYAELVAALRELLIAKGWQAQTDGNVEFVDSPDGFRLCVIAGDDMTGGSYDVEPRSRRARGPRGQRAVKRNQLALFDLHGRPMDPDEERRVTWHLMHLVNVEQQEIRMELGTPFDLDDEDYIERWAERIILPPLRLDAPLETPTEEAIDLSPEVVRRESQ